MGAEFEASLVESADEPFVAVRGEIDLSTCEDLWAALQEAMARSPRLVVDLTETRFIDSSGLKVFVRAYHQLGQRPDTLVLRGPNRMASRLLAVTGLDQVLTVEPEAGGRNGPGGNGDRPVSDESDTS